MKKFSLYIIAITAFLGSCTEKEKAMPKVIYEDAKAKPTVKADSSQIKIADLPSKVIDIFTSYNKKKNIL